MEELNEMLLDVLAWTATGAAMLDCVLTWLCRIEGRHVDDGLRLMAPAMMFISFFGISGSLAKALGALLFMKACSFLLVHLVNGVCNAFACWIEGRN